MASDAKLNLAILREPTTRVLTGENFMLGRLYMNGLFICHTCEDEDRFLERSLEDISERKIDGRTAIPRGRYRVVTSESYHFGGKILPEILDVPGFSGVRIHGGNRAEDSRGCVLVGKVRTSTGIAQCADMVARLISCIDTAIDQGREVWLEIK